MYHSFAVDHNGVVYAWGLNTFHQTGVSADRGGDEDMVITPTQVDALHPDQHDGSRVVQIAGGEHHTIFLFDNGEVWGCGRCDANQLGLSKDHPAQEGLEQRRAEAKKEKQAKVDEAKKNLEKVQAGTDVDPEDKEEAERAVLGAEAALSAALDEFVPEPVRVSYATSASRAELTGRSPSRPFRSSTRSFRPCSPTLRRLPPPTPSLRSRPARGTTSPSPDPATSIRGVSAVRLTSPFYQIILLTRCSGRAARSRQPGDGRSAESRPIQGESQAQRQQGSKS